MVYTLRFFPLQNAPFSIILTCLIPVLFTFYIQGVLKLKKNNSSAKTLALARARKIVGVDGSWRGFYLPESRLFQLIPVKGNHLFYVVALNVAIFIR